MPTPYPAWIQYSGLPARLREETAGTDAWLLFKTIIDLDCRNAISQTLDLPISQLASLTGIDAEDVLAIVPVYRDLKLAKMFLPDSADENLVIQISAPLPTPETHAQVRAKMIADTGIDVHRFCDCPEGREMDPKDPVLRQIIDLYCSHINCTMNAFTVDRLNVLRHKASLDDIRRAFWSAEKNQIRSLNYIERVAMKIQDRSIKNR